uniref:Uncharacterized protein n=1 Tax=Romanomermis culicivorax TaxID=13658 RepID=A0A915I4S3_ROMCU
MVMLKTINSSTLTLYRHSTSDGFNDHDSKYYCMCNLHVKDGTLIIGYADYVRRILLCISAILSCFVISCNKEKLESIKKEHDFRSRLILEWGVVITSILTVASLFSALMLLISLTSSSSRLASAHAGSTILWIFYEPFVAFWTLHISHGCYVLTLTGIFYIVCWFFDILSFYTLVTCLRYFHDKRKFIAKAESVTYTTLMNSNIVRENNLININYPIAIG